MSSKSTNLKQLLSKTTNSPLRLTNFSQCGICKLPDGSRQKSEKNMKNTLAYTELNHADEEKLITRVQNGDPEAFTPFVQKYQQRVYNLIYRRIRNHEAAEDICQEVFLKAWQALPDFKGKSGFYSWLHQIAVNCSIDFIRKQKREIVFAYEELTINPDDTIQIPQPHASPPEILEKEELGHIIRKAVTQLPAGQQRVFNLRYREELPIKEIAAHLNKSEGTVKSHLYHARQKLQEILRPYLQNQPLTPK